MLYMNHYKYQNIIFFKNCLRLNYYQININLLQYYYKPIQKVKFNYLIYQNLKYIIYQHCYKRNKDMKIFKKDLQLIGNLNLLTKYLMIMEKTIPDFMQWCYIEQIINQFLMLINYLFFKVKMKNLKFQKMLWIIFMNFIQYY